MPLLTAISGHAETQEEAPAQTPETTGETQEEPSVLDEFLDDSLRFAEDTRDLLSEEIVSLSQGIDSFIGDERATTEINGSHIRLRQNSIFYEDGSVDFTYSTLFKLDLPRTNERLSLVIESDTEDNQESTSESKDVSAPQVEATPDSEQQNSAINSAIQYILRSNDEWHVRAHAGIQFDNLDLNPNTKLRVRRLFVAPPWEFRITETLFWYNSTGWGETTQFDLERPIVSGFFFRTTNKSTWLNDTDIMDMSQRFTVYHDIGHRQLLSYQAAAFANSDPTRHITAYTLSVAYRNLIYKDWFFMDIVPVAAYPESNNFAFTPTLTISFEAVLGNQ